MQQRWRAIIVLSLCSLFTGFFTLSSNVARAAEPFYSGKNVNLYIGFGAGGSYDFFARLVGRHLGKHIPGNPNVIVQSMPGGGSLTAANFMYARAPRDGTALAIVTQTVAMEEVLGTPNVRYKSAEFAWIGRGTSIIQVTLTLASSKAKVVGDAVNYEIPMASTGAGSPSEGYLKLLNGVMGTRFKLVGPYPASNDAMLAMERGEVDGAFTSWNTLKVTKQEWLKSKKINILVQYARARAPDLTDVPAVVELGKTEEDRQMLDFYAGAEDIGRSFFAPPGLPPERIATLRRAYDATMKDPELLAEIERAKSEFYPASGEVIQEIITKTSQASPQIINRMRGMLGMTN